MEYIINDIGSADMDTRELLEVALSEEEPPDVRRTARETLAAKVTDADLVELLDGWEIHVDFGGLTVARNLGGIGPLVHAYTDLVDAGSDFYTSIATAIGEDFRAHLQMIAEKVAEEGGLQAGDPELGG